MRFHARSGLTLIEVLVVISILWILFAIFLPASGRARALARQTTCTSNLRQLGTAIHMYMDVYDEHFPPVSPSLREKPAPQWVFVVLPFMPPDSGVSLFCPEVPVRHWYYSRDNPGNWPNRWEWFPYRGYLVLIYFAYGFNHAFLSPVWWDCPQLQGQHPDNVPHPFSLAEVADPSGTVMVTDAVMPIYGTKLGYFLIEPPSLYWSGTCLGWFGGWTYDPADPYGRTYGHVAERHPGGACILWVDGHVTVQRAMALNHVRFWDRE